MNNWVEVVKTTEDINTNTDILIEELQKFIKEYLGDIEVK